MTRTAPSKNAFAFAALLLGALGVLLLSGCPGPGQPDAQLQQQVEDLQQEVANLESVLFFGGGGRSDVLITGSPNKPCERKVRTIGFPPAWICYPGDENCPQEVQFLVRPTGPDLWLAGDVLTIEVKDGGDPFGCFPGQPVSISFPALSGNSGASGCSYDQGILKYWQHDVVLTNPDCEGEIDREDPVVIMESRKGRR